jgi:hypothetical protein
MVRKEDASALAPVGGLSLSDRQGGMDFRCIEDGIVIDEEGNAVETPSLERNSTAESFYYAEEASLYSIAENSHEWEDDSEKPICEKEGVTEGGQSNNTTAVTYHSQTSKEDEEGKSNESPRGTEGSQTTAGHQNLTNDKAEMGVELCYAPEEEEGVVRSEEDHWQFYHHRRVDPTAYFRRRRRRTELSGSTPRGTHRRMTLFWLLLLIGVICLSAAVLLFQNRAENRSASVAAVQGGDLGNNRTSTPTAAPIPTATAKPTLKWILSENYVHSAIKNCQGTRMFFNASTMQGKVFDQLVQEVYDGAITSTASNIFEFAPHHTENYLREKYSLNVLYLSTNGPSTWRKDTNWMTPTDPCNALTPWFGLECLVPTSNASSAAAAKDASSASSCDATTVLELHLDANHLSGTLPMELCCLPCVRSIHMSNNQIGGDILWCLNEIPTLETISLENNSFALPAVAALSTSP